MAFAGVVFLPDNINTTLMQQSSVLLLLFWLQLTPGTAMYTHSVTAGHDKKFVLKYRHFAVTEIATFYVVDRGVVHMVKLSL